MAPRAGMRDPKSARSAPFVGVGGRGSVVPRDADFLHEEGGAAGPVCPLSVCVCVCVTQPDLENQHFLGIRPLLFASARAGSEHSRGPDWIRNDALGYLSIAYVVCKFGKGAAAE